MEIEDKEFEEGDHVQFVTGGPIMLFLKYSPQFSYYCKWFDATHNVQYGHFEKHHLIKVKAGK